MDPRLVAESEGQVVGYEWFSTVPAQVEERYHYRFQLPEDALYSYDAYTAESHRNRGIWRQIMVGACAVMAREGKVPDWIEAFTYGQAKASGPEQFLKLITNVVERQQERQRTRTARRHP